MCPEIRGQRSECRSTGPPGPRRSPLSLTVRPVVGRRAKITALATYVPPDVITNKHLDNRVEPTAQWIMERTGTREPHRLPAGQGVSDISVEAAKKCLEK